MKLFIPLLLLAALPLFGEPNWAVSYDQAFADAQKEHKGVMIMLSRKNCDACWYMDNIVFKDDTLVSRLEKSFIALHLDVHEDNIHGLTYIGTPTFYFQKSGAKTIKRLEGASNIKAFTDALAEIEKSLKK
jgi:thioredoxin-related protein